MKSDIAILFNASKVALKFVRHIRGKITHTINMRPEVKKRIYTRILKKQYYLFPLGGGIFEVKSNPNFRGRKK